MVIGRLFTVTVSAIHLTSCLKRWLSVDEGNYRSHAPFYTHDGLTALTHYLKPEGVFALWSDDPPDEDFLQLLSQVFHDRPRRLVTFPLSCRQH